MVSFVSCCPRPPVLPDHPSTRPPSVGPPPLDSPRTPFGRHGFTRTARELQTCTFQGHRRFKHHQNSTRRLPERDKKERKWWREGKKARNFDASTASSPSFGPHPSGPKFRTHLQSLPSAHFFQVSETAITTFGALTLRAPAASSQPRPPRPPNHPFKIIKSDFQENIFSDSKLKFKKCNLNF